MIYYHKSDGNRWFRKREILFFIEGIDEEKDNSHTIVWEYLKIKLGCKAEHPTTIEWLIDFSRDGMIFRCILAGMLGMYFCSPNQKRESQEYYEKLEKIVKELVEALNRDNHELDIALK